MYDVEYCESKIGREYYQASAAKKTRQCRTAMQAGAAVFGKCSDELTSVAELDDFLGQMLAAMTRQLGASASSLQVRHFEQNRSPLEFVFRGGRMMAPKELEVPGNRRTFVSGGARFDLCLDQPIADATSPRPRSLLPETDPCYLLGPGDKAVLTIPLVFGGQANGQLTFHFDSRRDLHPEELSLAKAFGTQTSLAIHLICLAQAARQSAVLEERNRISGEIHDSLAQHFAGIAMQIAVAAEEMTAGRRSALGRVRLAGEMAEVGLAEARRSALSLRPKVIEESGLVEALRMLVERSNIPDRLRCELRSSKIPETCLSPGHQHELLRITQEAISNAIRHAKPTLITVALRCGRPNLRLEIRDNGAGMAKVPSQESRGLGLGNMRARVSKIGGKLEIQTATGRGTSIVVTVPIAS